MADVQWLYIDLLKKSLSGRIYDPRSATPIISPAQCAALLQEANELFKPYLQPLGHTAESFINASSSVSVNTSAESLCACLNTMHRDITPDTMSDISSINNVQSCVEEVIKNQVPGDFIETGCWKGGLPVLMRGILKAYGITDRTVWAADSFQGLPKADPKENLADAIWFHLLKPLEHLKIPVEYAASVFQKYGLLDNQVKFLPGWFSDTLPTAPIQQLALMRLDGDWYESTMDALTNLYPKLSPGGIAIIDDYGLPMGCRKAVDEYREKHKITESIEWVNGHVVFWKKQGKIPEGKATR